MPSKNSTNINNIMIKVCNWQFMAEAAPLLRWKPLRVFEKGALYRFNAVFDVWRAPWFS
jgi:hypothetical protein